MIVILFHTFMRIQEVTQMALLGIIPFFCSLNMFSKLVSEIDLAFILRCAYTFIHIAAALPGLSTTVGQCAV